MYYDEQARVKEVSNPLNWASFLQACALHVVAFFVLWVAAKIIYRPPKVIIPIDMTVVVDENLDKPPDDEKPTPAPKEPEPPKPEPPKPEPKVEEPPPKLDDKLDAVVKEPEKKKQEKKKEEKKKEFVKGKLVKQDPKKKKDEEKKKESKFVKGELKKADPARRKPANGPRTDKKMSQAEIAKWLALGARPGTTNQLAPNEESRCIGVIANAIQREWARETFNWNASLAPIQVSLRLGAGGRVLGFSILKGSGDAAVDRTAQNALSRVKSILGLSADFIASFPELAVEMKPLAR